MDETWNPDAKQKFGIPKKWALIGLGLILLVLALVGVWQYVSTRPHIDTPGNIPPESVENTTIETTPAITDQPATETGGGEVPKKVVTILPGVDYPDEIAR
jgi:hypothetical protein